MRTLGALLLVALSGCDPNCRDACRHLIDDCGVERSGWGVEDCVSHCQTFLDHYQDEWQRGASRQSVVCVRDAACAELRAGTPCYDPAVYVW